MAFDDAVITPVAAALLGCLATQTDLLPNAPKNKGLRPGAQAPIGISAHGRDECCEGLAWVRLMKVGHSSTQNWPSPDVIPQGLCGTKLLALQFELGIVRCSPTPPAQKIVTSEQWNVVSEATYLDYIAMERAICCYLGRFKVPPLSLVGDWTPLGVDGNCVGGTLEVTIAAKPCTCQDLESPS